MIAFFSMVQCSVPPIYNAEDKGLQPCRREHEIQRRRLGSAEVSQAVPGWLSFGTGGSMWRCSRGQFSDGSCEDKCSYVKGAELVNEDMAPPSFSIEVARLKNLSTLSFAPLTRNLG